MQNAMHSTFDKFLGTGSIISTVRSPAATGLKDAQEFPYREWINDSMNPRNDFNSAAGISWNSFGLYEGKDEAHYDPQKQNIKLMAS